MHLITEVQAYKSLGILRPRGSVVLAEVEDLIGWMLKQHESRVRKFVVNLSQTTTEPDVITLLARLGDLALEPQVPICICLPGQVDTTAVSTKNLSPRVSFFDDEISALAAIV